MRARDAAGGREGQIKSHRVRGPVQEGLLGSKVRLQQATGEDTGRRGERTSQFMV